MGPKLAKISPDIHAEPKVNGSLMRINRDTRFSKDKTPYKTYMGLWFWQGDRAVPRMSGVLFRAERRFAHASGAGMHMFGPKQLAAYREALVHPKKGPAGRKVYDKIGQAERASRLAAVTTRRCRAASMPSMPMPTYCATTRFTLGSPPRCPKKCTTLPRSTIASTSSSKFGRYRSGWWRRSANARQATLAPTWPNGPQSTRT